MSIEIKPIQRRFFYNGIALPDIPGMEPKAVRELFGAQYPELLNAEIDAGPVQDGVQEFTFRKAVGTKGARWRGRLAAFAAEVREQTHGRLPQGDVQLAKALQRQATLRTSRALEALASQSLAANTRDPARRRLVPPSDMLPPLP